MSHIEPRVPLDNLDPGRDDHGYWERFQDGVMESAGPRLARRRSAAITPGEVLLSWSRMVVPATVVAAAVAALLLVQPASVDDLETVAGIEEILADSADGELPLPAFLHRDEVVSRDLVLFAVQDY